MKKQSSSILCLLLIACMSMAACKSGKRCKAKGGGWYGNRNLTYLPVDKKKPGTETITSDRIDNYREVCP